MLLFLMAASAGCRVIKVPDHPEALCFQIRGTAPPYVYAVGRGEQQPDGEGSYGRWLSVCGSSELSTSLLPGLCLMVHHYCLLSLVEAKACKHKCLCETGSFKWVTERKTVGSGEDYGKVKNACPFSKGQFFFSSSSLLARQDYYQKHEFWPHF